MSPSRIIGLALNPWNGAWMNRQQILSRLAHTHPVLYSTGSWSTWDTLRPEWKRAPKFGAFERCDRVLVDAAPAWLLRVKGRDWLDRRIIGLAAARWRRRMRREGNGPLVAYVFHPRLWPYADALKADVLVYHAYDLFRLQVGWSDKVAGWERALCARADLVLGSSEVICDELRRQGAREPGMVLNAADYGAYAIEPVGDGPADLAAIPRPRIGYLGKISRKVDLPLIGRLAQRRPDWSFVFVGGTDTGDAESQEGLELLRPYSNVHFLGFKPHTALPAYAIRMDANVISHRMDDGLWTKGTFPLKLFEYLAAGVPVVSADIPSVRPYASVVAIAQTPDEWERALTEVLDRGESGGSRDARRAVARANTWDDRVAQIEAHLRGLTSCCATPS